MLEDDRIVAIANTLSFNIVDPTGHRINHDGDRGLGSDNGQVAKQLHFRCSLFHFRPCRGWHIIRPPEPGVHLFLGKGHLPPAEIGHAGRAMGKCLKRPVAHHARRGMRIMRRPVYRPGLLLHHPPRTFRKPPHRIKIERRQIRMPRAHEWLPFISRCFGHELIGKTERIIVIADKIEVAG